MQLSRLLPISSVQYVLGATTAIDYMVFYTHSEYAFLRHDSSNILGANQIVSFTSFGVNVPLDGSSSSETSDRDTVLTFLKNSNPSLFGNSIVMKFGKE